MSKAGELPAEDAGDAFWQKGRWKKPALPVQKKTGKSTLLNRQLVIAPTKYR